MSTGAVSPASTPPHANNYLTSSTAPYQASPTNSNASAVPLTQVVSDGTDHTFTASITDHELNEVTTPTPLGTPGAQGYSGNTPPDSLALSGIGLHVSSTQ